MTSAREDIGEADPLQLLPLVNRERSPYRHSAMGDGGKSHIDLGPKTFSPQKRTVQCVENAFRGEPANQLSPFWGCS